MVLKLSESHSGVTSRTSQTRGSKQIYPGGSKRLPSRRSRRSFAKILHSMFCGRLSFFFFREMVPIELIKGTHFITSLHVWLSWGRISSMASRMTGTMHIREAGHHKHTVAWLISFFSSCFCGHWPIIHWWICLLNKLWKWCCIHQWICVSNIGSSWGWGRIVVSCLRPCDEVGHYMAWEGHHCWLAMQHTAQVPSRPGSTFLFALVASCCAWLVGHLWCVPALCALNWARVFCCPDDLYVSCFLPHWLSICSSFPILDSGLIPKMMTSRWSTGSRHAMILGIWNQKRAAVDSICIHNGVCLGAQLIQVCTCTGFKFIDPMTNNSNVNC